jgi:siroheme synthase-like protein
MQVDLEEKQCLVVGGGAIALHKTRPLVESGALVTVVSSSFQEGFGELSLAARHERRFEDGDIEGMFLVHAATNNPEVNHHIARICSEQNIWCCVADDTSRGSFGTPALLDMGDLRIAVSTNGLSPSYGARLRREIGKLVPDHANEYLHFLGKARAWSKDTIADLQLRMRFNAYLASEEGERLFEASDDDALQKMVSELLARPESIPEHFTPTWD